MSQKEKREKIEKLLDIPYSVTGKILSSDKKPVQGVIIRLYDQDIKEDDFLGSCKTDKDGHYKISFTEKAFRDGFAKDIKPDIYIKVLDTKGNVIHKTKTILNADIKLVENIILKEKPQLPEGAFNIHGTIIGNTKLPCTGLLIKAFDKDKKSADDFLGESWTDNNGYFEILFDESAFMDKNKKEKEKGLPDIYLNIYVFQKGKSKLIGKTKTTYNTKSKSYLLEVNL